MAELPVGTILDWAGTFDATHKPDAGEWKECDGTSLVRANYTDLFGVLNTLHGSADGTHFNLPNFKRRVTVGRDNCTPGGGCDDMRTVACCCGEEKHALSVSEMPSHGHTLYPSSVVTYVGVSMTANACTASGMTTVPTCVYGSQCSASASSCGSGTGHNVLQPYSIVYKLIKAKKAS